MMAPFGCDTFIALPPLTVDGDIIFGKNSDRPNGEVQEVVFYPTKVYNSGQKLQCTYIEIDQAASTHAVFLSKPAWMWGAEMGANSCGVVIGNEAVWTLVNDESSNERLLGMDLLRLGLERASSSSEAVDIITSLLEKYGQGGPCSDIDLDMTYHNSFLIADQKEAWVLETAGELWAAEKITNGYRNISNCLSIGTNITAMSNRLVPYVKDQKLWSGKGEFSFKDVFSTGRCSREEAGQKLLHNYTADKQFDVQRMFKILRDKNSAICMPANGPFSTTGSWVSALSTKDIKKPPCHWVTATPDPSVSVFKPFIFSPSPVVCPFTVSPMFDNDPVKVMPRFQFKVDRRHALYKLHEDVLKKGIDINSLKKLEKSIVGDTSHVLLGLQKGNNDIKACDGLFNNSVIKEMEIYSKI